MKHKDIIPRESEYRYSVNLVSFPEETVQEYKEQLIKEKWKILRIIRLDPITHIVVGYKLIGIPGPKRKNVPTFKHRASEATLQTFEQGICETGIERCGSYDELVPRGSR